MDKKNIFIIGSGGREHAIARQLGLSPLAGQIFCAPGNPGTALLGTNVDIKPDDPSKRTSNALPEYIGKLIEFAQANDIGLTVVGPEQPLVDGIVDEFRKAGLAIFGPTKAAAKLEGSKVYAKRLMVTHGVPAPKRYVATKFKTATEKIRQMGMPIVIKADGLAAGKGVVICHNATEAELVLRQIMLDRKFGAAGSQVVIEQFLTGQEISVLALCDGTTYHLLIPSQDHKRVGDGDTGPNTGGMGAVAPVPWATPEMLDEIGKSIFDPTLQAMATAGHKFTGCLYAGLMLTDQGPKVLEFNVRFGDPETQVVLPLLKSDLLELMLACCNGTLDQLPPIEWNAGYAVCVVITAKPYPEKPHIGELITGLDLAASQPDTLVFHAGTKGDTGAYFTAGGRVVGITAVRKDFFGAQASANDAASLVHFDSMHHRRDIGYRVADHFNHIEFLEEEKIRSTIDDGSQ